jgi:glycosyltransferase involved in cell wall biosynthesis
LSRDIEDRIERLQVEDAIRFTGYIPFEDLPVLYSLAEMFVFPSLYEGFGLPVIEAMACGTPVVTGHVAALSEVAGGAVEHVDRLDAESLGEAMVALGRSRERRENLSALGLQRAHFFSWDRAARETLEVYRQAAGAGRGGTAVPAAYPEVGGDAVSAVSHPNVAARTPSAPSTS